MKMPRPGPRPYECVRRAWHSDRHLPIRGSLIQEIFRVVNEVHSSATRKNKEWQEKLPVVVLKAEEIMYSRANSEAEYMDLKTLWDRTNDAINTIIRRDESTESGNLLRPCIEAALNLGCTPKRTSRSQQNSSPRCYLSSSTQDVNNCSHGIIHKAIHANHMNSSQNLPNYPNLIKCTIGSSIHSGFEPQNLICHSNSVSSSQYLLETNRAPLSNNNQSLSKENYPLPSLCSVYPLYYGNCLEPQHGFGILHKSHPSTVESGSFGVVQDGLSYNENLQAKICQMDIKDGPVGPNELGCDLSLRLGSLSAPLSSVKKKQLQDVKGIINGCSPEGSELKHWMPQNDQELCLSTRVNVNASIDMAMKKRKAVTSHSVEDEPFCCHAKLPCNHLTGRMKSAG